MNTFELVKSLTTEIPRLEAENKRLIMTCNSHAEHITKLANEIHRLRNALEEIAEGKGVYSRDPLEHAGNTIENMKDIAKQALAECELDKDTQPDKQNKKEE